MRCTSRWSTRLAATFLAILSNAGLARRQHDDGGADADGARRHEPPPSVAFLYIRGSTEAGPGKGRTRKLRRMGAPLTDQPIQQLGRCIAGRGLEQHRNHWLPHDNVIFIKGGVAFTDRDVDRSSSCVHRLCLTGPGVSSAKSRPWDPRERGVTYPRERKVFGCQAFRPRDNGTIRPSIVKMPR
jgi:hypothetical protein